MGIANLNHVFNPKRIAVIGASEREGSIGARILKNLTQSEYQGIVIPVNPFRQTVQGIDAYPSVDKIPFQVDLAVIATPAHTVPQIVEECGKAGVLGIIIVTAGFKEIGKDGAVLENQILEHQTKFGMRIIGANSFGVIRPRINLYATFGKQKAIPGKIAFISHSAALCAAAMDWAWEAQVGFSAVVSTGSLLDVDLGDLIDYFGKDPYTQSIVIYVESIKNARKFISAAREFTRSKPIVLVKAGRFKESTEAVLSHSGALGGEDAIYDAAFRRAGIVRVGAINDLFNCAEALAKQPTPEGPNLTIVTNAGGPAIMATDFLIDRGGKLSKLTSSVAESLRNILPKYCHLANPIDILEEATPERFRNVLEICLKDENSHGFLVIYTPQGATDPMNLAEIVVDLSKETSKPIITSLMGEDDSCREARKTLKRHNIPSFSTPEEAVSTFMNMYRYTRNLELLYETPKEFPTKRINKNRLKGIIRRAFCEGRKVLTLPEAFNFLEEYEIPTAKTLVAKTSEEAIRHSLQIGYPVAMKLLSSQIIHKFRAKGVALNVISKKEIISSFEELVEIMRKYGGTSEFQGVAIQSMIRKGGYELLLGSKKDPQFGPVVIFGRGGIDSELLKDVNLDFPPLNQVLARRLMEDTAIFKYSQSIGEIMNTELLEEILVKFSHLVVDFPEISEIDINPIIVDKDDAIAVDARIILEWDRIIREVAEHSEASVIASYPQKYNRARKLKDDKQVLLRPIKPEDEIQFNELFKSLSAESMHFRFFNILKELSHDALTRYCNLDYDREIAIVAELQQPRKQIIGAARLIVHLGGETGEFAVFVGDKWQGLGLGSKLMDVLIEIGKDVRLKRIYGYVLTDNYKMRQLCVKKGFQVETLDEETVKAYFDYLEL